jgi:hypothetical protein
MSTGMTRPTLETNQERMKPITVGLGSGMSQSYSQSRPTQKGSSYSPSKNEISEYRKSYNSDEIGRNNPISLDEAEYQLRNSDKYYYLNNPSKDKKAFLKYKKEYDVENKKIDETSTQSSSQSRPIIKYKELPNDSFGRKRIQNIENKSIYADVSGTGDWHTTSKDGEPEAPLRKDIQLQKN